MNKCVIIFITLVALITATVPEDICESCVHLSKCKLFVSMDKAEQQSWMQKYPCNNHHPDDYGTPPGSKTNQENFICCPNQVWGVEPKAGSSSRLIDVNQGNTQDTFGVSSDQSQYPLNLNNNYSSDTQNKDNSGDNNDGYINTLSNKWRGSDGETNTPKTNVDPSRWPSNRNRYWNSRPDRNEWDIGNPNFYHGNDNRRIFNNNRRNYYDNNGRNGRNSNNYNQGNRRNQPDDRNYSQYPYYPSNPRQSGNSYGTKGQCDRLTNFPPDPQSGCCGREASDDDRITGTPFKINDKNQLETKLTKTIDGGKETELTQFPWTVLLIATFENGFQQSAFNCGGSLISPKYVLTAGHCVYDSESVLKSVEVFLAEFDKRTFPLDCKITAEGRKCIDNIIIYGEDVIRHPQFDEKRLRNDIALVKLRKDAPYSDYIRPICLPSINIDNPEHNRLPLTVAGWGRNGQYKSDIKQSTTVHLVPQHDCKRFYPDLTPRHLCAAGYTGEDSCKGDSGGPLMVLYRGKYYVVGVVSGKRTDAPCGTSVPSLYTNVYHYLRWIRSNIKS